jgi:hypothetical protein
MPISKLSTSRRRSRAIPLAIVPALAALAGTAACSHRSIYDPCDQTAYVQTACDSAVVHQGYYYGGTWYPHVYPYAGLYYYNRYTGFLAGGGHVRSISPTVYVPSTSSPSARPGVVRGGFGSIGAGHGAAGS